MTYEESDYDEIFQKEDENGSQFQAKRFKQDITLTNKNDQKLDQ